MGFISIQNGDPFELLFSAFNLETYKANEELEFKYDYIMAN